LTVVPATKMPAPGSVHRLVRLVHDLRRVESWVVRDGEADIHGDDRAGPAVI